MTRLINLRQGMSYRDDWLPERWFSEPIPSGPCKGMALDRKKFQRMLRKYYELRGWDRLGRPTARKLEELGLK